jgi:hypothetical protein
MSPTTPGDMIPIDHVHRLYGRMRTTVSVDPAFTDIRPLMCAAEKRQLRGIAGEGRIWVWPAYEATHSIVREALGLTEPWGDFWIIPVRTDPLSDDWMVFDTDPRRNGMVLLRGHPLTQQKSEMQRLIAWFTERPARKTSAATV